MCVCACVLLWFSFFWHFAYKENSCLGRKLGSPVYPSYPGRANFSYILLQNVAKRLHENQKVGLARVTPHQAGSPFCDERQGHPATRANFSTLFFLFSFSYLGFVCLFVCL